MRLEQFCEQHACPSSFRVTVHVENASKLVLLLGVCACRMTATKPAFLDCRQWEARLAEWVVRIATGLH